MWSWRVKGVPMAQRRARGRIKMWSGRIPGHFTSSLIFIFLSILFVPGVYGQTCDIDDKCLPPEVSGGGAPSFYPNLTCYDDGSNVNISCSGNLYGYTEVGQCVRQKGWETTPLPTCEESTCVVAPAPNNGYVTPDNSYTLYDEVTYSCNTGLYLDGPAMAVCTGSGEWSPADTPVCFGNCSMPTINYGSASNSEDDALHEGIQIEIVCGMGYTLTGPNNVTCHDLDWSPDIGECVANCVSPIIPNSNYATDQGSIDHGEYIIVTCENGFSSGYQKNVSEPLTCDSSTWDGNVTCYADCPNPTIPTNGNVINSTSPYYHGGIVVFNCSDTYTLVGETTSTCENGTWSYNGPECKAQCLVPFIEHSNRIDETNSTFIAHGENVTVTCEEGYDFSYDTPFTGILICDDGTINDTGAECLVTCSSPNISNSNWLDDRESTAYGASIVVDCDGGFTSGTGSDQNETIVCTDGLWDSNVYCYANCPNISAPDGGNMFPSSATFYHTNTVTFNCSDDTYQFQGAESLTCSDGVWSDEVPECKASCPFDIIENSNYMYAVPDDGITPHGDYITVICDDGYTSGNGPDYNETLYCDDLYYNRTVYCYENCPNVTEPENGGYIEIGPPYYYGEKVNFTCDTNFTVNGNGTITCLDGAWSSDFPECRPDCTDPGTPVNGSQAKGSSYKHGEQVSFECDPGLEVLGAGVITCTSGTWSDPIPHCENETVVDQIRLSCDSNSFTVKIPVILLTDLSVNNVVLAENTSCTAILVGSFFTVTSRLDECGTILSEESITDVNGTITYNDVYSNTVRDFGNHSGPAVDIPLKCTFNRESSFEALSYHLKSYTISDSLSENGQYSFQFLTYEDGSFTDIVSNSPFYVGLDEQVHFGIGVLAGGESLSVLAETCWATPTTNSSDATNWDLITESCPADEKLTIKDDVTRALFSMDAFRFQDHDGLVYVHCDVLVCESSNPNCNTSCSPSRRRRSTYYVNPMRLKRVRAEPIHLVGSKDHRPDIYKRDVSLPSDEDSPFVYIVVISTLGVVCVILVASLAVVTKKLVTMTRYM